MDEASEIGPGGILPSLTVGGHPCPDADLLWNFDPPGPEDTGAFAWQYGGVVAPDYGAFAEGYTAEGTVCGMRLWLTTLPALYQGQTLDAYIYDSDGTNPTSVLSLVVDVSIDPPGNWPEITEHDVDLGETLVSGSFFVGFWGDWPGAPSGWWCLGQVGNDGGHPRTKIAPGIGYPPGWQDPSIVWGPIAAMAIGAFVEPSVVPTRTSTWSEIKSLYGGEIRPRSR